MNGCPLAPWPRKEKAERFLAYEDSLLVPPKAHGKREVAGWAW
jgi:hypothetical protein